MHIIIKTSKTVFAFKIGPADIRAIVLAATLAYQQHHQPDTAPVQDPFAGSGSLVQALEQVSSWSLPGSDAAIFAVKPCPFSDDVTAPQTRSSKVTSGRVK